MVIEALLNNSYTDSLENIFINAQTQILLLYSMECMVGEDGFACKFLANEAEPRKDRDGEGTSAAAYRGTDHHQRLESEGSHQRMLSKEGFQGNVWGNRI